MKYSILVLLFVVGVAHAEYVCTTTTVLTPYGLQICKTCCTDGVCHMFCV